MFFYFLVRGTYRGHVSSLPDLSNSSTKTFMVKEQHSVDTLICARQDKYQIKQKVRIREKESNV